MDGGWTQVHYRRRGRRPQRDMRGRFDGAFLGWTDRAPYASTGWWGQDSYPPPNQPVPPPRRPRYFGPQSRSYASVVRGRQFNPGPGPGKAFSGSGQFDQVRRQPADPKFGRLVRKLHMLIKMAHHLHNVSPKEGIQEPLMISRMVEILSSMIKPAAPTSRTMDMICGNANNWGYNTLTILMDHYKAGVNSILKELPTLMIPEWNSAFRVAVRWARRNIPRVSQGVIDHVEALIIARVTSGASQKAQEPSVPQDQGTEATGAPQKPQSDDTVQTHTCCCTAKTTKQTDSTMQVGDMQSPRVVSPLEQREGHRIRKRRGVVLTEEADLLRELDRDGDDWRVEEVSDQDSTYLEFAAMFDALDEEQEREMLESRVSPILSGRRLSCPEGSAVQNDQDAESDREDLFEDSMDRFVFPEPQRFQVKRHINTQRKLTDWNLMVTKKWLIMGDSNLSQIPDFFQKDLQVESFPGSHFRHAQALIEKSWPPQNIVVEKVVLSFGINGRGNKSKETSIKNLQGAMRAARRKFPYAEVWVPLINFSSELPLEERENLQTLNDHVERNMGFIPLLPRNKFSTEADDIHWTEETAQAMLDHWINFLNFPAL